MSTIHFLWDFGNDSYLMEEDEIGNTTAVYSNEPERYGRLISQRRDNATRFFHYDGQDSMRQLTDELENVTDDYAYTAFGDIVTANATSTTPFQYVGRYGYYNDAERKVFYVRARHYQSTAGRWLSRDPVGFNGSFNLFLYLGPSRIDDYPFSGSSPVMFVDPSGKFRVKIEHGDGKKAGACGSAKFKRWKFVLNAQDRKNEPCEGYIVQQVTVKCEQRSCTGCGPSVCGDEVSSGEFTYFEAWYVKEKAVQPHGEMEYTDEALWEPDDESCGSYSQTGEVQFFCISVTGNLGRKGVNGTWPWKSDSLREFGEGSGCSTGAGRLPSFDGNYGTPDFWKVGGDAPAYRSFNVIWECCDANKGKRKATTTYDP